MSGGDRYYSRLYSNVPTSTQTTKNENSGIFLLKEVRSKILETTGGISFSLEGLKNHFFDTSHMVIYNPLQGLDIYPGDL